MQTISYYLRSNSIKIITALSRIHNKISIFNLVFMGKYMTLIPKFQKLCNFSVWSFWFGYPLNRGFTLSLL